MTALDPRTAEAQSWDAETGQDRPLRASVRLLRRRWGLLSLLSLGIAGALTLAATVWDPPYSARAVLQVPTTWTGSLENVQLDVGYTERLLNTYVALADSGRLHEQVTEPLDLDDPDQLAIEVEVPANTELLIASAESAEPDLAITGANATAELLAERIRDDLDERFRAAAAALREQTDEVDARLAELAIDGTEATPGATDELLERRAALRRSEAEVAALGRAATAGVTVIEPAEPPAERLDVVVLLGLAAVAGLLGAVILTAARDHLDTTVRDVAAVAAGHGYVPLGVVDASDGEQPIDPDAMRVAYRLRAKAPRRLMVTSVHVDDGVTARMAGLARALAAAGARVIVVDTSLAPTALGPLLGVETRRSTPERLRAIEALPETAERSDHDNLWVLPDRWPTGVVGLPHWRQKALEQLEDHFDVVLVFVPALVDDVEASLFAEAVEGTVLLASDGAVREDDLRRALRQIDAFPGDFVGVVVGDPRRRRTRRRG